MAQLEMLRATRRQEEERQEEQRRAEARKLLERQRATAGYISSLAQRLPQDLSVVEDSQDALLLLLAREANYFGTFAWENWLGYDAQFPHLIETAYDQIQRVLAPVLADAWRNRSKYPASMVPVLKNLANTFAFPDMASMRALRQAEADFDSRHRDQYTLMETMKNDIARLSAKITSETTGWPGKLKLFWNGHDHIQPLYQEQQRISNLLNQRAADLSKRREQCTIDFIASHIDNRLREILNLPARVAAGVSPAVTEPNPGTAPSTQQTPKFQKEVMFFNRNDPATYPNKEKLEWAVNPANKDSPFSGFTGFKPALQKMADAALVAFGRYNHNCADFPTALVGPKSAGKTTLARIFAKALDLPYIEIDARTIESPDSLFEVLKKACADYDHDVPKGTFALVPWNSDEKHFVVPPSIVFVRDIHCLRDNLVAGFLGAVRSEDGGRLVLDDGTNVQTDRVCWLVTTTKTGLLPAGFDKVFRLVEVGTEQALLEAGRECLKQNKCREAISFLNKAIQLNPRNSQAYLERGRAHDTLAVEDGPDRDAHVAQAFADLNEAIRLDPTFSRANEERGRMYLQLDEEDKGIADLKEAIRLEPDNRDAVCSLTDHYINDADSLVKSQPDKTLALCNAALELDPSIGDCGISGEFFNLRGIAYLRNGQIKEAIKDFIQGIKWSGDMDAVVGSPSNDEEREALDEAMSDKNKGDTHWAQQEYQEAYEAYVEGAIECEPGLTKPIVENMEATLRVLEAGTDIRTMLDDPTTHAAALHSHMHGMKGQQDHDDWLAFRIDMNDYRHDGEHEHHQTMQRIWKSLGH